MRKLKLLVIAAHPADMFDHCGGTLLHHTRRGDSVTAVSLTHGLRIHDIVVSEKLRFQEEKPSKEELDQIVRERSRAKNDEVLRACALFGVTDVRFLNHEDDIILVTEDKIRDVARIIREVKPDILITHYPLTETFGCESSHGNVGKIVLHACEFAGTVDFDDPSSAHRTAEIFFMSPVDATTQLNVLSGSTPCYINCYVPVTDVAEQKVKALDMMRSQQYGGNYARKEVERWSGIQGSVISESYAEGFIRYLPEYNDCLPICEKRLERQNEEEKLTRQRTSEIKAAYVELHK